MSAQNAKSAADPTGVTAASSERKTCARCGGPLRPGARFCSHCGKDQPGVHQAEQRRARARVEARAREARRATLALALGFGATLGALVLAPAWGDRLGFGGDLRLALLQAGLQGAAGVVALVALGRGSFAASLGRRPTPRWLLLSPLVGLGTFALAVAYVALVAASGGVAGVDEVPWGVASILAAVVLAPLLEEWVDRGVLWTACRRVAGPQSALWATAVLFAFSHGLNGGFVLEFPHRFAGGLALGWLRLRSGSLLPPLLAHATWNALALWAES